eukprot:jgi/Bigna1/88403/estExt_fgenesh1_pg.C_310141
MSAMEPGEGSSSDQLPKVNGPSLGAKKGVEIKDDAGLSTRISNSMKGLSLKPKLVENKEDDAKQNPMVDSQKQAGDDQTAAHTSGEHNPAKPYIGAHISLLSNANYRYEGILFTINPNEETVSLRDVRFFGTEGRNDKVGKREVPGNNMVYPYLSFEGKNIQDLTVQKKEESPSPDPMLEDPAIRNAHNAGNYPMYGGHPPPYGAPPPGPPPSGYYGGGYPPYGSGGPAWGPPPTTNRAQPGQGGKDSNSKGGEKSKARSAKKYEPGTGNFLREKYKIVQDQKDLDEDFDFTSSTAKYDKDGFAKQMAKENAERLEGEADGDEEDGGQAVAVPAGKKKYDAKTSFFDNLSSSVSTPNIRDDPADVETFGKAAENYRSLSMTAEGDEEEGAAGAEGVEEVAAEVVEVAIARIEEDVEEMEVVREVQIAQIGE